MFSSMLLGKFPLGRLPPPKIATDPKPNPHPNPNTGGSLLRAIFWGDIVRGQFSSHLLVPNQYNQTITKFVLKSNFQDIHKPE